jgi:hypothetical protein
VGVRSVEAEHHVRFYTGMWQCQKLPAGRGKANSSGGTLSDESGHGGTESIDESTTSSLKLYKWIIRGVDEVEFEGIVGQKGVTSHCVRRCAKLSDEIVINARYGSVERQGGKEREVRVIRSRWPSIVGQYLLYW